MPVETEREYGLLHTFGVEHVQRRSDYFLALGIVMLVLGLIAIVVPQLISLATTLFIGAVLLIRGLAQVVHAFWLSEWGGFFLDLLAGFFSLVVGGLLLVYPIEGVLALTLLLGTFFLVYGTFEIAMAFALGSLSSWVWMLISGIVSIIVALFILANYPSTAVWAIGLLVGIELFATGASLVVVASEAGRSAHRA